jgi:hypothetical protein
MIDSLKTFDSISRRVRALRCAWLQARLCLCCGTQVALLAFIKVGRRFYYDAKVGMGAESLWIRRAEAAGLDYENPRNSKSHVTCLVFKQLTGDINFC